MSIPKWLTFSLLTMLSWGAWSVLSRGVGDLSAVQTQVLSTLGVLPIMLLAIASPNAGGGRWFGRGAMLAFGSGVIVGIGNLAYYKALATGAQATVAVSMTALYPMATILLALVLLREKPNGVQVLGILASLLAIYLLNVTPVGNPDSSWFKYAIAPIALWGAAGLTMKLATEDVSAELATFWFFAAFVPLAGALVFLEPMQWSLPPQKWIIIVLIGFTYALGNWTLLVAYRSGGKASVVTPLGGLYPVVAIPLAILFFQELVTARQWSGISLALVAAVAMARETPIAIPEHPELAK